MSNTTVSPGDLVHGFRITRAEPLPALRAEAVEAVHDRTGARLIHLGASDAENLFAIALFTPPPDNTGLPHILEHAVLAGSRRFPVKDPFVEMLKSSMATFINAFTCADRTIYPVASNVPRDFFNLADVYLDAVFHPLISRDTLMQEGWHWGVTRSAAGSLSPVLQGIVLNEMRGAFSDLDTLVERESLARLFADGTYGRDAGGEPHCIPDLTHAAFTAYYARCYHPSNARLLLYGDIPIEAKLEFLNDRLSTLTPGLFSPPILVRQPAWYRPQRVRVALDGRADDESMCNAAATVSWVVGDLHDPESDLAWELLDRLLLGDDAAPLRRQLLESGIGDELTCCGYFSDSLQTTFQVGMKGGAAMKGTRLEPLVLAVLRGVAITGFAPDRIRDAFRQLEYGHREIDSGFPLHVMEDVFSVWLYGLDPLAFLHLDPVLKRLRNRLDRDPSLLCRMITRHLLDNPHRLSVILKPRTGWRGERERQLAARTRAFAGTLSAADLGRLKDEAARLEDRQSRPNSPADVAKLPTLHMDDLPRDPATFDSHAESLPNGVVVLHNDVPSNGISYITLAFDVTGLPDDLLPYVPAYSAFLSRLGTAQRDYLSLSEAITRTTGGLIGNVHISPELTDPTAARPFLVLQARTLDETCQEALALLGEVLDKLDVADGQRLRDVVMQRQARMLGGLISQGHYLAGLQAASHIDRYNWLGNLWRGQPQFELARAMAHGTPDSDASLAEALHRLQAWLCRHAPLYGSFTGTDYAWTHFRPWLASRPPVCPCDSNERTTAGQTHSGRDRPLPLTGIAYGMDVAFCARCLPAAPLLSPEAPLLQIAAQILSYDYLWEEVRAKGGAYGAFCVYDPMAACFAMLSHSDPDIARTLGVFEALPQALQRAAWTRSDIERAVIACAREEETPIRPGMATDTALWRHVAGITQTLRRDWRQALLAATADTVRKATFAMVHQAEGKAGTAVLSSRGRLLRAGAALGTPLSILPLAGSPRRHVPTASPPRA